MKRLFAFALLALILVLPRAALAYHYADFAVSANDGGGAGVYFTAAPRWKGYDCTMCHVGAPRAIAVELASEPAELIAGGMYTPGQTYSIGVKLVGASRGDTSKPNGYDFNSFVAEIDDDAGRPVGSYDTPEPASVYTMAVNGGDPQVVAGYADKGETSWTVRWTAPEAGTGRVALYLAAVDGNAAGGGVKTPVDPFGDDVFTGKWRFCEAGTMCDRDFTDTAYHDAKYSSESPAAHGCSVGRFGGGWGAAWLLGAFLALARRRAWLLLLAAAGCANPTEPWDACAGGGCVYDPSGESFGDAPSLDAAAFRCDAQPVLMARCSFHACHGDADRPFTVYAPGRLRLDVPDYLLTKEPLTAAELEANYAAAIAFARGDEPEVSLLLLKPLDVQAGGYYHFGEATYNAGDVFRTTADPGYQRLLGWLAGGTAPPSCEPDYDGVGPRAPSP